jgi:hypothetical protein
MAKKNDLSGFFTKVFSKYDTIVGQPQINHPRQSIPKMEEDQLSKSFAYGLYPEKAGLSKYNQKKEDEQIYKAILMTITEEEYGNLKYLQRNEGRLVLTKDMLKSMGEEGNPPNTERLENWELMKREGMDDCIEFRLMNKGRKVINDIERLM